MWAYQTEHYGILKTSKKLLIHVDNVLLKLIDYTIEDLKTDSFDELMDYLEGSTTDELIQLLHNVGNNDRLIRCIEIVLSK